MDDRQTRTSGPKTLRLLVTAAVAGMVIGGAAETKAEEDPWLGPDKGKHFGVSAGIAAGGYTVGAFWFEDRSSALVLGGAMALGAGIGKEIYDATGHGTASERDLVWDVAGTATGLGVAWLVDWVIRGDRSGTAPEPGSSASAEQSPLATVVVRF